MDLKENGVEELERVFTDRNAEPIRISYSAIKSITKNLCTPIGRGGFGTVYLGALTNDVMVAVKELHPSRDFSDTQFLEELKCLRKVNHENIVRFLGYCAHTDGVVLNVEGEDRLVDIPQRFFCFEYAPNGCLEYYLKGKSHGYEWSIHYKIIKGICQGLNYLHKKRLNHLDLKPANVLLGAQMKPMITDFGLSRCNDGTQSTVVTCNVKGTLGYMAPELINERKISSKADIFSLGIIMKNLLAGSDNENIAENGYESLNADYQQMKRCSEIAEMCTDEDPYKRPTISHIINMLTETETTIENVPVIITEPRNDPTTVLYKNVRIFLARDPETTEYSRGPVKRPVERAKWKLSFKSPLKLPIFVHEEIEDANGKPLELILVDADTGEPSAVPNALEIELVPLLSNFPRDSWDADDFQRGVVKDPEGRWPLLGGQCRLTMWDGCATVNEIMFKNHPTMLGCGCMFRIGVCVMPDSYHGPRILEAMTEAFMVRDRRLDDESVNKWQVVFACQPQYPIYINRMIRNVIGNPLEIILVDLETGSLSALQMELDIQLVLLKGSFPSKFDIDWSAEEFRTAIEQPREGEGPVLIGDINRTMKADGHVIVNKLELRDHTYRTYFNGFRIGVCVMSSSYNGPGRILEGITEGFKIQLSRTKMDTKLKIPHLSDEVWRLESISWGGVFHKRLTQSNVRNVQDFLRMLVVKRDELRAIMGEGMDDSTWEKIAHHALNSIIPVDKVFAYSVEDVTIYVNSFFLIAKIEFGSMELTMKQVHELEEAQKIALKQKYLEAYEHRDNLQQVQLTLKLAFKNQPRLAVNAGCNITDINGDPLEIILVDAKTGSVWELWTTLGIQLVPIFGDFPPYDGKEDWSAEEFQTAIVMPRHEYVPLLKAAYDRFVMRDGRVTVIEPLHFTDDSSWVRCRKFRIGACVVPRAGRQDDVPCRILEAVTEAFVVTDLNRKHYPPVPSDPVWRVEMIDKDGPVHNKLTSINVNTVKELIWMLSDKEEELRTIVGDDMTDKMWQMMIEHTMTSTRKRMFGDCPTQSPNM